MTKQTYYDYVGKCALATQPFECYLARTKIDSAVNATNTSAYNIYSKCYSNKKG